MIYFFIVCVYKTQYLKPCLFSGHPILGTSVVICDSPTEFQICWKHMGKHRPANQMGLWGKADHITQITLPIR